jgi:hypothetical protein
MISAGKFTLIMKQTEWRNIWCQTKPSGKKSWLKPVETSHRVMTQASNTQPNRSKATSLRPRDNQGARSHRPARFLPSKMSAINMLKTVQLVVSDRTARESAENAD